MLVRRSPARLLIASAAFLAAGALGTVLVACGFGLWGSAMPVGGAFPGVEYLAGPGEAIPPNALAEFGWALGPVLLPAMNSTHRAVYVERWRGPGSFDDLIAAGTDGQNLVAVSFHGRGWPMPALHCKVDWRSRPPVLQNAWIPPDWVPGRRYGFHNWQMPVPLRPEPVGFVVNTLFNAGILYLLVGGTRYIRRADRACRGHCPVCGYSRAGLASGAPCPECGKAEKSLPSAAPPATSAGVSGSTGV